MTLKITSLILGSVLCCSSLMAQESSFEAPANRWIKENSRNLGIQNFSKLTLYSVRKGHTGETLRYQQFIKEVPVFQSEILVHFNKEGKISYTSSESLKKNLKEIDITPAISSSEAFKRHILLLNRKEKSLIRKISCSFILQKREIQSLYTE